MSHKRTTTLDVTSSVLNLTGDWIMGNSLADPLLHRYNESTYLVTTTNHSRMSFDFSGFEVTILGAYRPYYGQYQVYLDDIPQGPFRQNNNAPPPESDGQLFQQHLFHWSGSEGAHTISIENLPLLDDRNPNNWDTLLNGMDVDMISWTSSVASSLDVEIQNDDSRFVYSDDSWKLMGCVPSFPMFSAGDAHITTDSGSYFNLTFAGERLDLYGTTGRSSASYTVQLDAEEPRSFNGSQDWNNVGHQLIYSRTGLSTTFNHTVQVTANLKNGMEAFAIDYALLDGTLNPAITPLSQTAAQASGGSSGLGPSDLAAIILGIVGGISIMLAAVFWFLYRRQKHSMLVLPHALSPSSPLTPRILAMGRTRSGRGKSTSSMLTPFTIGSPTSTTHTDIIRSFPKPPPGSRVPHPFSAAGLTNAGYSNLSPTHNYPRSRRGSAGIVHFNLPSVPLREGPQAAHAVWPQRSSGITAQGQGHSHRTERERPKLKVII